MKEMKKSFKVPIIAVLMSGGPVDMTWAKVSVLAVKASAHAVCVKS